MLAIVVSFGDKMPFRSAFVDDKYQFLFFMTIVIQFTIDCFSKTLVCINFSLYSDERADYFFENSSIIHTKYAPYYSGAMNHISCKFRQNNSVRPISHGEARKPSTDEANYSRNQIGMYVRAWYNRPVTYCFSGFCRNHLRVEFPNGNATIKQLLGKATKTSEYHVQDKKHKQPRHLTKVGANQHTGVFSNLVKGYIKQCVYLQLSRDF